MIGQNESHYRAYRIPGGTYPGGYEVASISIYRQGQVLFNTNRGYLENYEDNLCLNVLAIDIPDPVKANKVNLFRSDVFFVSQHKIDNGRYVDLYIPEQIGAVVIGPELEMQRDGETHMLGFYRPVMIALHGIVPHYTGEKDSRGDYIRTEKRIKVIHERTAAHWELTEDGKKAEELRKQMETLGLHLAMEEVIKLLNFYAVTLK